MPHLPDIETEADVAAVVHAFYRDMEADPTLGTYFAGLDWQAHLPKMISFWSSVVFQTGAYRGRPFDPHARMPGLERRHFAHWVERFHGTVDALFAGPRADVMKGRAEQIAGVFQVKLGLWPTLDAEAA
ncbi:group III truncated hemoglobin [Rubrivirga sp. S365]|uniref:group III truncated hemoglobin n=1 Tax=Rubrivirga sp. S365 TaxID=3076080 RepID=UPI0028C9262A|nr:group III truncated hemoglobin [Rubrivirga sp. S365]MDT7856518.1 group III truncated hemoglobin [Rubrivirga sp. S365]